MLEKGSPLTGMETLRECRNGSEENGNVSVSKRRAEIRRRKLLMNSEDRMNRIMGFSGSKKHAESEGSLEHRAQLDPEKSEAWPSSVSPTRASPFCIDSRGVDKEGLPLQESGDVSSCAAEGIGTMEIKPESQGKPSSEDTHGLEQYLSRFDEAMRLREQLAGEKPAQETGSELLDLFSRVRLIGSVLLAIFVRFFVCNYLSIFAPFLTLQLVYLGTYKYFPKSAPKMKNTVLTAALMLSRIPAELIERSMYTYSKMGDVFTDLCVYLFTFVVCHEMIVLFGLEGL